jgi:hypothetical protein
MNNALGKAETMKGLERKSEQYTYDEPKPYTLKSRRWEKEVWTEEQFATLEELGQEMLYKTCNGWYCLIEPHEQEEV